jgi:hypothetical protein
VLLYCVGLGVLLQGGVLDSSRQDALGVGQVGQLVPATPSGRSGVGSATVRSTGSGHGLLTTGSTVRCSESLAIGIDGNPRGPLHYGDDRYSYRPARPDASRPSRSPENQARAARLSSRMIRSAGSLTLEAKIAAVEIWVKSCPLRTAGLRAGPRSRCDGRPDRGPAIADAVVLLASLRYSALIGS